uniref:Uncharacterized protein n=1 Tax=Anguilla anguilla TaxID=7936 RepID=A0A0E9PPV6_ANGAN
MCVASIHTTVCKQAWNGVRLQAVMYMPAPCNH